MKIDQQGFAPLIILAVLAGTLVTGAGVSVAANGSKPGDALYSIDRSAEKVQLALAITNGQKLTVKESLAKERLTELQGLYADNKADPKDITELLNDYDKEVSDLHDLQNKDGLNDKEKKVEAELESKKSEIDKTFESKQKSLENDREALKKQYEEAVKSGNTSKAQALQTQINGFEATLKKDETVREAAKKTEEKQQEQAKTQSEAEKKAAEQKAEAAKQAAEQH